MPYSNDLTAALQGVHLSRLAAVIRSFLLVKILRGILGFPKYFSSVERNVRELNAHLLRLTSEVATFPEVCQLQIDAAHVAHREDIDSLRIAHRPS